jgi:acetylglutamate kinase
VGLSGVDGGILRCSKMQHPGGDLGLVGKVEQVDPQLLRVLLLAGFTPVLAPIGVGDGGALYNVNADAAAVAIAVALQAEQLELLTDVAGIMVGDKVQASIDVVGVDQLIAAGVIREGMLPKAQAALEAARAAVSVRIVDLAGLDCGAGTVIRAV